MSNSFTGDTNAPTAGIKVGFGAGADQVFTVRDMQNGDDVASFFCSGSEVPGTSCFQNGMQPEARIWHIAVEDIKAAVEAIIAEASPNVYELALSMEPWSR